MDKLPSPAPAPCQILAHRCWGLGFSIRQVPHAPRWVTHFTIYSFSAPRVFHLSTKKLFLPYQCLHCSTPHTPPQHLTHIIAHKLSKALSAPSARGALIRMPSGLFGGGSPLTGSSLIWLSNSAFVFHCHNHAFMKVQGHGRISEEMWGMDRQDFPSVRLGV